MTDDKVEKAITGLAVPIIATMAGVLFGAIMMVAFLFAAQSVDQGDWHQTGDGKQVFCFTTVGGGISCDWEHAR